MSTATKPPNITPALTKGGRFFLSDSSGTESSYVLPADDLERERLELQGACINLVFGNKLILAPVSLQDGDVILDSGTGSGQWILSVAKEVPSTIQLRGVDPELRMFPPNPPSNVKTTIGSITSLPKDWRSSIALIHQRLLIGSLQEHAWKSALKEMYRTLVPGGWVQLFEPFYPYKSPSKEITNHPVMIMCEKLCNEKRGLVLGITSKLPGWLEEAGFVGLKIEKWGLPLGSWAGEHGKGCAQGSLDFFRAIGEAVGKENWFGMAKSAEEYDELVADLERKCEEIPESYFVYHAHVAQKPVDASKFKLN